MMIVDNVAAQISSTSGLRRPHTLNRKDGNQRDLNNKTKYNCNQTSPRTNSNYQNRNTRYPNIRDVKPDGTDCTDYKQEQPVKTRQSYIETKTGNNQETKFGQKQETKFGNNQETKFGLKQETQFGNNQENKFGHKQETKFGINQENKSGQKQVTKLGNNQETKYGQKQETKFGNNQENKFGINQETKFGNYQENKFRQKQETKLGNNQETKFGQKQETKFGNNQETKFGQKQETKFGNNHETKYGQNQVAKRATPKPKEKEPLGSVLDVTVTPKTKTIVPKEYLLETLSLNDTVLLSVDSISDNSYICLTLHEKNENDYQLLCGEFGDDCEKQEKIDPKPGDLFALFYQEDGAWYRGRRLSTDRVALIDCSRVVIVTTGDKMVALPSRYLQVAECCCLLTANVQLGDSLECTLVSKTADGFKVCLRSVETDVEVGQGQVSRWTPAVEYEVDKTIVSIPEVTRPCLPNLSSVFLVQYSGNEFFLRPSSLKQQEEFEQLVQDGVEAGMKALPLKEPPHPHQTVLGQHTDGFYYRALCKRTNIKKSKYLIEYIEYGNTDILTLEKLSQCPEYLDITKRPTVVSVVKLDLKLALNENGQQYLDKIRDDEVELVVNSKDKSTSIGSGSNVDLVEKNTKKSVTTKLELLCCPEWKKINDKGGDVVDCETLMYSSLKYIELPTSKCELSVLDINSIRGGALGVCDVAIRREQQLAAITEQIDAYVKSDLGKDPYLPKIEELCLAPCPPYPQYFRAVLCSHTAGCNEAKVCYIDYNNLETVEVSGLRKMMKEFMKTPALACHAEIKGSERSLDSEGERLLLGRKFQPLFKLLSPHCDGPGKPHGFPANPSKAQLMKAVQYMKIDNQGRGLLPVDKCVKADDGFYVVEAPRLLEAMMET